LRLSRRTILGNYRLKRRQIQAFEEKFFQKRRNFKTFAVATPANVDAASTRLETKTGVFGETLRDGTRFSVNG
jgi:hypothetical protein